MLQLPLCVPTGRVRAWRWRKQGSQTYIGIVRAAYRLCLAASALSRAANVDRIAVERNSVCGVVRVGKNVKDFGDIRRLSRASERQDE